MVDLGYAKKSLQQPKKAKVLLRTPSLLLKIEDSKFSKYCDIGGIQRPKNVYLGKSKPNPKS